MGDFWQFKVLCRFGERLRATIAEDETNAHVLASGWIDGHLMWLILGFWAVDFGKEFNARGFSVSWAAVTGRMVGIQVRGALSVSFMRWTTCWWMQVYRKRVFILAVKKGPKGMNLMKDSFFMHFSASRENNIRMHDDVRTWSSWARKKFRITAIDDGIRWAGCRWLSGFFLRPSQLIWRDFMFWATSLCPHVLGLGCTCLVTIMVQEGLVENTKRST